MAEVDNAHEWNKYYAETYAFHLESENVSFIKEFYGNPYVSVYHSLLTKGERRIHYADTSSLNEFSSDTYTQNEFIFGFPPPVYVNTKLHCYYFPYYANKQWKKSFSSRVVYSSMEQLNFTLPSIKIPNENMLAYWYWNIFMKTGKIEYPSFKHCLDKINNKKSFGKAFSPDWALKVNSNCQYPVLYYHHHAIGAYKDDVLLFPKEVKGLLERLDVDLEVVLT